MNGWRDIRGFEGVYQVSALGEVRRVKAGRGSRPNKPVNPSGGRRGYARVSLYDRDRRREAYVHALVTDAFLGPCPDGREVNHRDGNKVNNHVSNLGARPRNTVGECLGV